MIMTIQFNSSNYENEFFELASKYDIDNDAANTQLEKINKLIETLNETTNIDVNEKASELYKNAKENIINLNEFKAKFGLNEKQYTKIYYLSLFIPLEDLRGILDYYHSEGKTEEITRILNTYYRASDIFKKGLPSSHVYEGKTKGEIKDQSYSFAITKDGELVLAFEKLARGAFKKVNAAFNVNRLDTGIVKVVARGEKNVQSVKDEEEIKNRLLSEKCPYLIPPSEIRIDTQTKDFDPKTDLPRTNDQKVKYVYFEKRAEGGTAIGIPSTDFKQIAQVSHDLLKGLTFIHKKGYIHCDAKPPNILLIDNRGRISDFGLVAEIGKGIKGSSPFITPPEYLRQIENTDNLDEDNLTGAFKLPVASEAFDSFSAGLSILYMLDVYDFKKYGHHHLGFLTDAKREEYFQDLKDQAAFYPTREEKDTKLKLIDLAERLTTKDPKDRLSCADAAKEIGQFPGVDTSDPE